MRLVFLSLLLIATTTQAGTVVETREQRNAMSWTEIDGNQVRMSGVGNAYILVNSETGRFTAVFPDSRQAIDMGSGMGQATERMAHNTGPRKGLKRVGKAEPIAGFATEKYFITADDRLCAQVWLSSEALEAPGIKDFLRSFRLLYQQQRSTYEARGLSYGPCDDAQQAAMDNYENLGLPMRIQNAEGNTLQEVITIQTGVSLDQERFRIPDDYELSNAEDM